MRRPGPLGKGVAAVLLWVGVVAAAAFTEPPPLTPEQVIELFSDKTIEGRHVKKKFSFRSYYDPGGVFFSIRDGRLPPLTGRWWVERDGRMCIQWEGEPSALCRHLVRTLLGGYRKVLIHASGKRVTIVKYSSFEPGKGNEFR